MRTTFGMTRVVFSKNLYDAFDGDFVEGTIVASVFLECGNDAIDVSGSRLKLEDVRMETIGDKGLSAGEDSHVEARNLRIERAEIAVAGKDLSTIRVEELHILGGGVAFAAYRKKPEFGRAVIEAIGADVTGVRKDHLIEEGSLLTIDGEQVSGTQQRVEAMLYGAQFGTASVRQ
jgi:hypothetical protein